MKKSIIALLFFAFALSIGSIAYGNVTGNEQLVNKACVVLVLSVALPMVAASKTTTFLGLKSKDYFDDSQNTPLTRAEKALWDYLKSKNANSNTLKDLAAGNLRIVTYAESLKFQIAISTGGRIELLNYASVARQGRIAEEWNLGALPEGFNLAISHIRVAYGTDAALLPEAIANYTTVPAAWPAALQHGQLIISQSGAIKERVSGRFLGSAVASTNNGVEGDGFEFHSPLILEEVKPTKIELFCPVGVTFPATPAILAVSVELFGAAIRQRS